MYKGQISGIHKVRQRRLILPAESGQSMSARRQMCLVDVRPTTAHHLPPHPEPRPLTCPCSNAYVGVGKQFIFRFFQALRLVASLLRFAHPAWESKNTQQEIS